MMLKELRDTRNLTQAELGDALNISPSTIGMYEQGRREPSLDVLQKLADYFHVTTDELLGRDAPKPIMEEMTRLLLAPPDGVANPTKEMLDDYSSLSAEGKEKARSYIKYLASEDKEARIKKDYGKSTTA